MRRAAFIRGGECGKRGGSRAFLNKIGFMDITRLVESSLEYSLPEFGGRVEQILEVDRMVREDTIAKAQKIKR